VWIALALATLAQASGSAVAAPIARMAVSQGHARLPSVTLYLDLLTATGEPPSTVSADRLTVTIGAARARVDRLTPFDRAGTGVAYVFVADVSRSMSARQMAQMRAALLDWVGRLSAADRAALVTFGDTVTTVVDFADSRETLRAAIEALQGRDDTTKLHLGLSRALELGRRADANLPARRAIVVLSDGRDEGSGLTADDLAAQIRQDRVPIYTVGYTSHRRSPGAAVGLAALARVSANSGGVFREAGQTDLEALYAEMDRAITRVFVATLTCDACDGDGGLRPVQVTLDVDGRVLTAGVELRVPAGPPTTRVDQRSTPPLLPPVRKEIAWWAWPSALGGLALVGGLAWVAWRRRRVPPSAATVDSTGAAGAVAAVLSPPQLTVHMRDGGAAPRTFPLASAITIGADPGCTLSLNGDPHVAAAHCEVFLDDGRVVVRPLDPERPTLVNGVPVRSRLVLESGDLLLVGRTEMRLTIGARS
jgi:Mg-chelatase subunit ChlD